MNDLKDFIGEADRLSPFIRFDTTPTIEGTYKGSVVVDDNFNPGDKTVEYTVNIEGVDKTFRSKSLGLGRQMLGISNGTRVEITRTGESFKTKWSVNVVTPAPGDKKKKSKNSKDEMPF